MPEVYDIGDEPRITVTFTDLSGTVGDPTTVTCIVKTPSGASRTYTYGTDAELTQTSTGIYNLDLLITEAGEYRYKFNGTNALAASVQGRIAVRKSLA